MYILSLEVFIKKIKIEFILGGRPSYRVKAAKEPNEN